MRQTRLSIGCSDWIGIVKTIGPEAAGILVYLRMLMRSMQAAEISVTVSELAETLRIPREAAETALAAICPRYLERVDAGDIITLRSPEEEKALMERARKRAAKAAAKIATKYHNLSAGNSAGDSPEIPKNELKTCHTDFFMRYDGNSEKKEKAPEPRKEKSLTEQSGRASMHTRDREPELPADSLEAEYIDVVGSWSNSLREALKKEPDDVREAFYLAVRLRNQEGSNLTGDRVRIAWLAARRIPPERRADSILAWAMSGWKTIRDVGSGMYFEKETGRIVSLVRGPVEAKNEDNAVRREAADLALQLARTMRRS